MISFSVTGDIEIQARLNSVYPACLQAAVSTMTDLNLELARYIIDQKLSGQVLNRVTGTLQSSVRPIPTVEVEGRVTGGVEQDSGIAPYGKYHEYGAWIPAVRNTIMAWTDEDGSDVFTNRHKRFRLPVRSFMRSALRENKKNFEDTMVQRCQIAIFDAWQRGGNL